MQVFNDGFAGEWLVKELKTLVEEHVNSAVCWFWEIAFKGCANETVIIYWDCTAVCTIL